MGTAVGYSYENKNRHLSSEDALEAYKKAVTDYPNAIVVLDDLSCGDWDVHVYNSEKQKATFYRKKLNTLYKDFLSRFTK